MLLSDEERKKFAEYLEADATSSESMAEQLQKLPGFAARDMVTKKFILEARAARIIAAKLRGSESFSISTDKVGE